MKTIQDQSSGIAPTPELETDQELTLESPPALHPSQSLEYEALYHLRKANVDFRRLLQSLSQHKAMEDWFMKNYGVLIELKDRLNLAVQEGDETLRLQEAQKVQLEIERLRVFISDISLGIASEERQQILQLSAKRFDEEELPLMKGFKKQYK